MAAEPSRATNIWHRCVYSHALRVVRGKYGQVFVLERLPRNMLRDGCVRINKMASEAPPCFRCRAVGEIAPGSSYIDAVLTINDMKVSLLFVGPAVRGTARALVVSISCLFRIRLEFAGIPC